MRSRGVTPWRLLVTAHKHHSKPFSQILQMGKNSWPNSAAWQGQAGGQSWSYWPGTWRPPKAGNKWQKGAESSGQGYQKEEQKFPAYNEMPKSAANDGGSGTNPATLELQALTTDSGFTKVLQKHLNNSRRLEAKARKLAQDRDDMAQKWTDFQAKLRESFIGQRQKFLNDTKKVTQELQDVQQQRQDNIAMIQDLVAHKGIPQVAEQSTLQPTEEDVAAWNDLMTTPMRQDMDVEDDQALQRALQAAHSPSELIHMTLSELANANGPLSENVLQRHVCGPAGGGAGAANERGMSDVQTPPRRVGALPGMTPARVTARKEPPQKRSRGDPLKAVETHVPPYATGAPTLVRDPYMSSPYALARPSSTSPVTEPEAHFGPIRASKPREGTISPARAAEFHPPSAVDGRCVANTIAEQSTAPQGVMGATGTAHPVQLIDDDYGDEPPAQLVPDMDLGLME